MELVKLLQVHQYSVDIYSYSGLSGIWGSVESKIPLKLVLGPLELLHFPLVLMNTLNKTKYAVF